MPQWNTVAISTSFFLCIFVSLWGIIDFEGCVFWGAQPRDSVVDVLTAALIWIFTHVGECTWIVNCVSCAPQWVLADYGFPVYLCVYVNAKLPNYPCIYVSSLWIVIFCCCCSKSVSLFLSWKFIYSMKFYILPIGDILSLYLSLSPSVTKHG